MTSNEQAFHVRWSRVMFVRRFSGVLYPVDIIALLRRLPEIAFVVPRVPEPGESLEPKDIPAKGNVRLVVDAGNKTLGILADDLQRGAEEYAALFRFWSDKFDPGPGSKPHYAEIHAVGAVERSTRRHPEGSTAADELVQWWRSRAGAALDELNGVIQERLGSFGDTPFVQYGLRLASPGGHPNRPDWAEITLNQLNPSQEGYYVEIVWRDPDEQRILDVALKLNDLVGALVTHISRSSSRIG